MTIGLIPLSQLPIIAQWVTLIIHTAALDYRDVSRSGIFIHAVIEPYSNLPSVPSMNRVKENSHQSVSSELRERAESMLEGEELSAAEQDISNSELVRELQLQRIELKLQNKELRRYRDELETSRKRYSNLYLHAPVGHITLDEEAIIEEINFLAAELLGANRQKMLETSLFDHVDSGCRQRLRQHKQDVFDHCGVQKCALEVTLPTDTRVKLRMMSIAAEAPIDGRRQWRTALFDITEESRHLDEKDRLEKQLHESHRMETLGRLASGIAHDFNNLLTLIIGYSKLAINQTPEDAPLFKHVSEINKAGRHAGELIEQLLAFSRSDGTTSGTIDINELIKEMETMFDRLIGDDIELHLSLCPAPGTVHFDSSQFQQVLMNLVVNAKEAMNEGGNLFIRSRNVVLDEEDGANLKLSAGPHVVVEVEDDGNGIPPEVIPHIFEPFFTTKPRDNNHGCGLSTIYGIVSRHGGAIDVATESDGGTTFSVYLPRTDEAGETSTTPATKILVVDDQPDLREFASLVLQDMEVDVISARSPQEALKLSRAFGSDLDLVVTDVTMPGMSGPLLLEEIRRFHPETSVLYISGYNKQSLQTQRGLDLDAPFLEKPFSPDKLLEYVGQILDE